MEHDFSQQLTAADFARLASDDVPAHTCAPDSSALECSRCIWRMEQFAVTFPTLVAHSVTALEQGPGSEAGEYYSQLVGRLSDAEVTVTTWWFCAVFCVQLANGPVTVDRGEWGPFLACPPHCPSPRPGCSEHAHVATLDALDEIFVACLTDDAPDKISSIAEGFDPPQMLLAHMVLAVMANAALGDHVTLAQQATFQMLLTDAPPSIADPYTLLLTARIVGHMVDGHATGATQILNRVLQQRRLAKLVVILTWACARHLEPGYKASIGFPGKDGVPETVTADTDLTGVSDAETRGTVLGLRLVTTQADGDATAHKQVKQQLNGEEPAPVLWHLVETLCRWYAEIVSAALAQHPLVQEPLA